MIKTAQNLLELLQFVQKQGLDLSKVTVDINGRSLSWYSLSDDNLNLADQECEV